MNKYSNIRTVIDNVAFASKKEANRYLVLKFLQKAKEIDSLILQPRFKLLDEFIDNKGIKHKTIEYVADFMYMDKNQNVIVEDVKGMKTDVYKLKLKFFLAKYPFINFMEI